MLAQEVGDFGEIGPAIAWIGALAVAFGPGAMGITKIVDFIRGFDKDDTWPSWSFILLAFVIAGVICLAFQINIVGGFFTQLPAFAGSTAMDGWAGQAVSALGLAGSSSYWHHRMALAAATTRAANAEMVVVDETLM